MGLQRYTWYRSYNCKLGSETCTAVTNGITKMHGRMQKGLRSVDIWQLQMGLEICMAVTNRMAKICLAWQLYTTGIGKISYSSYKRDYKHIGYNTNGIAYIYRLQMGLQIHTSVEEPRQTKRLAPKVHLHHTPTQERPHFSKAPGTSVDCVNKCELLQTRRL